MEYLLLKRFYETLKHNYFIGFLFFILWLSLFCYGSVFSQQALREEVVASYIYNFAQNTQWVNESKMSEFKIKVISRNLKIFEELNKISIEKQIKKKPIKILIEDQLTNIEDIQLIFVEKDKEASIIDVFDKIEGKNILLVTDNYYNKKIVMINFFDTRDHKLKFEINKANIINQSLTLLPDMVLLGGAEIDVAELYKESQVSLRTLQKQLEILMLHEQELKKKIENSELIINRYQKLIYSQAISVDSQKFQLIRQKNELNKLLLAIQLKQNTYSKQSRIIKQHENELKEQKVEIDRREEVLKKQQEKIDYLNTEIKYQNNSLKEQKDTISTQKQILLYSIAFSIFGIVLFITIYRGYKIKKKTNALLIKEIEERRKVEDALGKSEDLYNNAPCGYHSLDKDGVFVRINDTELKWLGYNKEEVINKKKFTDLITEKSLIIFQENFPRFKALGEIRDIEFEMIRKDGTILPISLSATAIKDKDGNYIMSRSNIFDISYRKRAEEEILKLNLDLEKRVLERTSQLEASNKELEAFAYSVSHDLRAPLRSIDGFSQMILDKFKDKIDDEGIRYIDRVRIASQRMAQLIDDMLSLSRIIRVDMNFKNVNLSEITKEISEILKENQPERNVEFVIQDMIFAKGDPRLLKIVLENLIGNAWKFTSKHNKALIEFGLTNQNGMDVYFVRDDGAGFEMDYAQKIFGVFQRMHDSNDFPGTGIGLATVQRIINRHGGKVWAEGQLEKGATFYFTIP